MRRQAGFTLIELMVALAVMALVALLSWRGLDAMLHARAHTQAQSDRIATLQTVLAQWRADLDAMAPDVLPRQSTLDWNGQSLRLLRLNSAAQAGAAAGSADTSADSGLVVVAWTLRSPCAASSGLIASCWMRWQSPLLRTRGEVQNAWQQAANWGTSGSKLAGEQSLLPLDAWQLQGWAKDSWAPLQAVQAQALQATLGAGAAGTPAAGTAAPPATPVAATPADTTPAAIRLLLTVPGQAGLHGTLTVDWLRPHFTRERN